MVKRLFILGAVLFSSINFLSAQITFQKTFGGTENDVCHSIQQTSDGGYILAGWTYSFGAGAEDIYLIKTNVNGDSLWTKTFGGINHEDAFFIQQTADGGYLTTGYTVSFGAGNNDIYLIKTDANGDLLWTKSFGGLSFDAGYEVLQTIDGGYIITGTIYSSGSNDVCLIKTDANGDSLWTKTFGGTGNDLGNSIQQTTDGGFIISGFTSSFGAGGYDIYLIKTDVNGNLLWTRTFGGALEDKGNSVQQTTDGGYIICGWTLSFGAGAENVYLIKTDINGNLLWSKTFGGTIVEEGYSVQQTTDGGYIIAGNTFSFSATGSETNFYLIKTDANGDSLWTKTFGGADNDEANSVHQTMDGGYIIGGSTYSFGSGFSDFYLVKTDSLGNSGCNESGTPTIVTSPATQMSSPASIVGSANVTVTSPATVVGSGGVVSPICTTVGFNIIDSDNSFVISPNPSAGNFNISFESTIVNGNIEIFNTIGEKVLSVNISSESKKVINLDKISGGIYFVKVFNGEKYSCKKIIIERD